MDKQLDDLIEPAPVAFEFGAPGWYVLGILVLLLLALGCRLICLHVKRNRYRQTALHYLQEKEDVLSADYAADLIYEAQMLVKRIAMSRYGRERVAAKRKNEWIEFVNSTWKEKSFDERDEALLETGIYMSSKVSAEQANEYVMKVRQWIKKHKRNLPRGSQ